MNRKPRNPDVYGLKAIARALAAMSPNGRRAAINWIMACERDGVWDRVPEKVAEPLEAGPAVGVVDVEADS